MINRAVGKAIHSYEMISEGDRICVGLSGGKDSLTLMKVLSERLSRSPVKYELFPVYIDPGFGNSFSDALGEYARKSGYNFTFEMTDDGVRAHDPENTVNPCFICSRQRRRRLFEIADRLGCNKLALGHNKDDIIETLFINMCYSGQISTMMPAQPMFKEKYTIIRPLALVDEETIIRYAREISLPVFENPCPSANQSKRKEIKDFLAQLYGSNSNIKGNIFRSMAHVNDEYLLT